MGITNSILGGEDKKDKKTVNGWKKWFMDAATKMIPGGENIEDAMKKRTGNKESMKEKHFPGDKKDKKSGPVLN